MPPPVISCRPIEPDDRVAVVDLLESAWGSVLAARKGELFDVSAYPGFVAEIDGALVGLAVTCPRGEDYEVLSLTALVEGQGVGRALMQQCFEDARGRGCRRVWLTTTNNNIRAIAFYQHVGMTMCGVLPRRLGGRPRAEALDPLAGRGGCPYRPRARVRAPPHLSHLSACLACGRTAISSGTSVTAATRCWWWCGGCGWWDELAPHHPSLTRGGHRRRCAFRFRTPDRPHLAPSTRPMDLRLADKRIRLR